MNQIITTDYLFAGYQFRVAGGSGIVCTLADNVNPLYIPYDKSLSSEFELIMENCEVPFFITSEHDFRRVLYLSSQDSLNNGALLVFRCAILNCDAQTATTEYLDKAGKTVTATFDYVTKLAEPKIEYKKYGHDVIDATIGGGVDSAIHTYNLCSEPLNESGLLATTDAAVKLRNYANLELSDHGPFSIWNIGLVKV